jgi:hypothetical protein
MQAFISNPTRLDIWSSDYFHALIEQLVFENLAHDNKN